MVFSQNESSKRGRKSLPWLCRRWFQTDLQSAYSTAVHRAAGFDNCRLRPNQYGHLQTTRNTLVIHTTRVATKLVKFYVRIEIEIEIETTILSKNALRDSNIVLCRPATRNENDRRRFSERLPTLGRTQRSLTGFPVAGLNSTARNLAQFSGQHCSRGERSTQTEKRERQRRAWRVRNTASHRAVTCTSREVCVCRSGASSLRTARGSTGTAAVRSAAFTMGSLSKEGQGLCVCDNPERLASNSNKDQLQW